MSRKISLCLLGSLILMSSTVWAGDDYCSQSVAVSTMSAKDFCQQQAYKKGLPSFVGCYVFSNVSTSKTLTVGSIAQPQLKLAPGMEACVTGMIAPKNNNHPFVAGYYEKGQNQNMTQFTLNNQQGAIGFDNQKTGSDTKALIGKFN
jgi:hypothetical protein